MFTLQCSAHTHLYSSGRVKAHSPNPPPADPVLTALPVLLAVHHHQRKVSAAGNKQLRFSVEEHSQPEHSWSLHLCMSACVNVCVRELHWIKAHLTLPLETWCSLGFCLIPHWVLLLLVLLLVLLLNFVKYLLIGALQDFLRDFGIFALYLYLRRGLKWVEMCAHNVSCSPSV